MKLKAILPFIIGIFSGVILLGIIYFLLTIASTNNSYSTFSFNPNEEVGDVIHACHSCSRTLTSCILTATDSCGTTTTYTGTRYTGCDLTATSCTTTTAVPTTAQLDKNTRSRVRCDVIDICGVTDAYTGNKITQCGLSETACNPVPATFTLDVDEGGSVDINDGLIIVRYLDGDRGRNLTTSLTTTAPSIVAANIRLGVSTLELDVDGDDDVDSTDGALIASYLLNGGGSELVRANINRLIQLFESITLPTIASLNARYLKPEQFDLNPGDVVKVVLSFEPETCYQITDLRTSGLKRVIFTKTQAEYNTFITNPAQHNLKIETLTDGG